MHGRMGGQKDARTSGKQYALSTFSKVWGINTNGKTQRIKLKGQILKSKQQN